jgi:hypothetical protein
MVCAPRAWTSRLATILGVLSRTELEEICRVLELDDSGKEKVSLVSSGGAASEQDLRRLGGRLEW